MVACQTGSLDGHRRHPCSGSEGDRFREPATWILGQSGSAHGQLGSAGEASCHLSSLETEDAACLVVVVHGELLEVRSVVVGLVGVV